jgi:hypothetical protein
LDTTVVVVHTLALQVHPVPVVVEALPQSFRLETELL